MAWYRDWQFWAIVPAVAAIVLSQLPPLRVLLRKPRLVLSVHHKVGINHVVGMPVVLMFITLQNIGGRSAAVSKISVAVTRDGREVLRATSDSYFEAPSSKEAILFTPFDLAADARWSHPISFAVSLDRREERRFEEEKWALRDSINTKLDERKATNPDNTAAVQADPQALQPLLDRFARWFPWEAGEYVLTLKVELAQQPSFEQSYRFVLFEGDRADLASHLAGYGGGFGVLYDVPGKPILAPLEIKT